MNRRGFLHSLAGLLVTATVAPADILKLSLPPKLRKLRAVWTIESARDLRALHGEDVERVLIAGLADAVVKNCDRHFIGLE